MIWRLAITPGAERDFRKIPRPDQQRIKDELFALADEAHPRSHVKKLKGQQDTPLYSLRVGRYRVILAIEDDIMVIFVIEVGDRSTIYRNH
jgi:mRNA interferase RelE/StbE